MKEKEYLTVFSADIARAMLKKGYFIVDIKADKFDPEKKRSIFIFKNEGHLHDDIIEYKNLKTEVDYHGRC